MIPSVQGTVVDVVIEAEYRGAVYERTVSIENEAGVIDCFEGKSHVTEDDCGRVIDLVLLARSTGKCSIVDDVTPGIEQPDEPVDGRSPWRCKLLGKVCDTDVSDDWFDGDYEPLALVNVGIGTVLVAPTTELTELIEAGTIAIGTGISLTCSRLDIVGLNDGP